ncbi:MAG: hypothetical protein EPO16_02345 [Dehalococcoidia bacterium]|nr:MAG: hypothetical protein EPO16_02345 [Dehalococcoidia bacterium]
MSDERPLPDLHDADARAVAGMGGVVRVYANPNRWWQNATFALPLLVTVVALLVGFVLDSTEAKGFGLFGLAVTVFMVPVVLLTWRGTATAVVLTAEGATALHLGQPLHEVPWADLQRIEKVEYLGNTRYKLVHHDTEFLTIESEIEDAADLVETAFALSGVPRQHPEDAI